MLMVFFLVVYNTAKRKDRFTHWVAAFVANGIGLTAVWSYWLFRPGTVLQVPLTALYFAGKAAFVLMLLYGVRRFIDRPVPSLRASLAGCVALATLLAVVTRNNIALIGMAWSWQPTSSLIASGSGTSAIAVVTQYSHQVPSAKPATRSPTFTCVTPSPIASTIPAASLPPVAGSGGRIPYEPRTVQRS